MYLQDLFTAFQIRKFYRNTAVETAGTQKGRIQGIRTVGGCQNNNALSSVETVHLGQQLVQCLLALIISGESAAVTLLADGINLIDEDDTRRFLIAC